MVLDRLLYLFTSKENLEPVNLCFKGGGVKGCAYVGVYKALQENGFIKNVQRIIGSSAGAIFASAVALKIPPEQLQEIILQTDFSKFKDQTWGELYNIIDHFGYYSGDYFYQWYSNLLKTITGNESITFQQVFEKFNIDLVITASDITEGELCYFSKDTTPNMELRIAVRCSMSIPFFYIPVQIPQNEKVHYYIDGGCMNNYPIDYFSDSTEQTWGFNLIDDTFKLNPINSIIDFTTNIILTEIKEINKLHYSKIPNKHFKTIDIPTFGIKATDFDLSKEKIEQLINVGYQTTLKHCLMNR